MQTLQRVVPAIIQYGFVGFASILPLTLCGKLGKNVFNRGCSPAQDADLQAEVNRLAGTFFNKHSFVPSIVEGTGLQYTVGVRGLPTSVPIIYMPEQLRLMDEAAYGYLLKFQFSQLKHRDLIYTHVVGLLLTLPGPILVALPQRTFHIIGLYATVLGTLATFVFMYYVSRKTEGFAIAESTNEELQSGLCLYSALYQLKEENWDNNPLRWFVKKIISLGTPSLNSRIHALTVALKARNVQVYSEAMAEKAPLLAPPGMDTFDLDSPAVKARILKIKAIFSILGVMVSEK